MRLKPRTWFLLSLLLFVGAALSWRHAENLRLARQSSGKPAPTIKKSMVPVQPGAPMLARVEKLTTNAPGTKTVSTNKPNYRLSNTVATPGQLARMDRAILLRNASIDTALPMRLKIPDHLRSKGDPGSYLVKSDRPLDKAFYDSVKAAGAEFISYIPNNAALVGATPAQAATLRQHNLVLPYEPQFKLDDTLLAQTSPNALAMTTNYLALNVMKSRADEAKTDLEKMGVNILAEDRNPFGKTLIVQASTVTLASIAGMPSVLEVETVSKRKAMNDLTRARLKVSANTQTTNNWLNLDGSNIVVSLNDTGVDGTHPDFDPTRIFGLNTDNDGHGTHVAGIIAGSGLVSSNVTVASGSIIPAVQGQFRGMAPGVKLFVQSIDDLVGAGSDSELQEAASKTNAFISNNSWGYIGSFGYSLAAASYDAAVRDSQPDAPGSQSMVYVFAAGNDGAGDDSGQNGQADTIGSPAAGKNVITVGAIENPRNITNGVSFDGVNTNAIFAPGTDSRTDVASFSSRGNVGIGVEGDFGRYKPDVVAPGEFIISTRATNFVDPKFFESVTFNLVPGQSIKPGQTNGYPLVVTPDTIAIVIEVLPNSVSPQPFPQNIPILLDFGTNPATTFRGDNVIFDTNIVGAGDWTYGIVNPNTNQPLALDIATFLIRSNTLGDYFQVLSNLNNGLRPYYRYESGTSMSAPAATGVLALLQQHLERDLNTTNHSPALMKALLINGARSLSSFYDFQVNRSGANDQGWGLINVSNSAASSISGVTGTGLVSSPLPPVGSLKFSDETLANVLTTGQSQTRIINNIDPAAASFPLRITLTWTDPPGNPAAGVKLVNDLDLIVSNMDTGDVYIGNNFPAGDTFTIGDTNIAPSDVINNVENVYISTEDGDLASSYSVTVRAKRVNVNAVTALTNGIAQDYALVISSGDSGVVNAFDVSAATLDSAPTAHITTVESGVPLLNQRVGANSPLLTTTNGAFEQWHFFVFTNTFAATNANFTNVAFVTFLPPNLSRPRNEDADIDLYVTTDPGLLNLNAGAIAGAKKSLNRGGTEAIIYTNSAANVVYYAGVKSEDQQAAEFGFFGYATDQAFGGGGNNDNDPVTANGLGLPVNIPDGSFDGPGKQMVLALMTIPVSTTPGFTFKIRKVSVTDTLFHQNMGDLFGELTLNGKIPVVLNNHSSAADPVTLLQTLTYDDLPEDPNAVTVHPDGPGSLKDYVDQPKGNAAGSVLTWMLTETDNALTQTGRVDALTITASPQPQGQDQHFVVPPCQSYFGFTNVPSDGTNLIISITFPGGAGSANVYLRKGDYPDPADSTTWDIYTTNPIVSPGGSLSIGTNNIPPLTPGYWFFDIVNSCSSEADVTVHVDRAKVPDLTETFYSLTNSPLLDDAVTSSQIFITNRAPISAVQVGVRIDHPRVSDLSLRLVSPQGTSVLLFEDRGGLSTTNLGLGGTGSNLLYTTFTEDTNLTTQLIKFGHPFAVSNAFDLTNVITSDFEDLTNGTYIAGQIIDSWMITTNQVGVISDSALAISGTNFLALANGTLSYTFPSDIGRTYQLTEYYRGPDITNWWPADGKANDLIGGKDGVVSASMTYLDGEVNRAFKFNDATSQVSYGTDVGNFATNDFSFDFWMETASTAGEEGIFEKRTVCNASVGFVEIGIGASAGIGRPYMAVNSAGVNFCSLSSVTKVNDGLWHHVAFSRHGATLTCYIDGKFDTNVVGPGVADITNPGDFHFGQHLCACCDGTVPYTGLLDEFDVFNRELSPAEVAAIYEAGRSGKINPVSVYPNYQIIVNNTTNSTNNVITGPDGPWMTNVFAFTATTNVSTVALHGNPLGVLLDKIVLNGLPLTNFANYFLPEESLDAFIGENGYGAWTLQVWDNRAGTAVPATLVNWNLQLTFSATNVNLLVLTNGSAFTNTVAADSIMYFAIDAPDLASRASNVLMATTGGPLDLLFNQNSLPTGVLNGDYTLLSNVGALGDTNVLSINSPQPTFIPGQRYFLGVQNTTGVPQDFSLNVTFDVTTNILATALTNGVALSNNITTGTAYQYYYFDVPTNAILASFEILNPSDDVDLLVRHAAPLPNNAVFDYRSAQSSSNDEAIVVGTNSSPVPLTGGRWYVAVYNSANNNTAYNVIASYVTNGPTFIDLTNNVFYSDTRAPGYGFNTYYRFTVTNTPEAVQFDVTNLTGNVDLLVSFNTLPTPQQSDRAGFNPGTVSEKVIFATNSDYPVLNGTWYLAVPNNETFPVDFRVRARTLAFGATNFPAVLKFGATDQGGFSFNWNSVPGKTYSIDLSTNLIDWNPVTNIMATDPTSSFTDPDPIDAHKRRFYRLTEQP